MSQKRLKVNESLINFNICSLSKNFDDFCILLKDFNINSDMITMITLTESGISKKPVSPIYIKLENYSAVIT